MDDVESSGGRRMTSMVKQHEGGVADGKHDDEQAHGQWMGG